MVKFHYNCLTWIEPLSSKDTSWHVSQSKTPISSLIRAFHRLYGSQGVRRIFSRKTKTLTRMCRCVDWFESSLWAYADLYLMLNTSSFISSFVMSVSKYFERKIVNIFLPISWNICFGCLKEPSHWDGSFEYPQHMFWLRNKKIIFSLRTLNLAWYILLKIIEGPMLSIVTLMHFV